MRKIGESEKAVAGNVDMFRRLRGGVLLVKLFVDYLGNYDCDLSIVNFLKLTTSDDFVVRLLMTRLLPDFFGKRDCYSSIRNSVMQVSRRRNVSECARA